MKIYGTKFESIIITEKGTDKLIAVIDNDGIFHNDKYKVSFISKNETDITIKPNHKGEPIVEFNSSFKSIS